VYLTAQDTLLAKILKMAVTMTTRKTHHDENFPLVLVYWHQVSGNEQSPHHTVHEVAQDRLSVIDTSTRLTCFVIFAANIPGQEEFFYHGGFYGLSL
jgi:hypothetical protein